jgi:hypothetical protein
MVKVSFDIPSDLHRKVKHRAIDMNISMKALMIKMIEEGLISKKVYEVKDINQIKKVKSPNK